MFCMERLIKREAKDFDKATYTITDFTLKVMNLPSQKFYKDTQQLRALMTEHMKVVV